MTKHLPAGEFITAEKLTSQKMLFIPDNMYEAAKFQEIAFACNMRGESGFKFNKNFHNLKSGIITNGDKFWSVSKKITADITFGLTISPPV